MINASSCSLRQLVVALGSSRDRLLEPGFHNRSVPLRHQRLSELRISRTKAHDEVRLILKISSGASGRISMALSWLAPFCHCSPTSIT